MKYKMTNVSERVVGENLPDLFRFNLQPGESVFIEDIGESSATTIVHLIKSMRGLRGAADLFFEEILEDKEVAKILDKTGSKFPAKK